MARVQLDLHTENTTSNETAQAVGQMAEDFVVALQDAGFEVRGNGLRVQLDPEPDPVAIPPEGPDAESETDPALVPEP